MASSFTNPMATMFGPTSATAPVASAAPVSGSGVNPSTGAYYTGVKKAPADGTAPAGGATLATGTPNTDPYGAGTYSDVGNVTGDINHYNGSIYAGNGTFGALGTNAPTGGIGNVSGAGSGATAGTAPVSGSADSAAASAAAAAKASAAPTYGTESGPGLLDQWFNERATGTDPGYEYATKRGLTAIDNAAAARGGYNGGAAEQGERDYMANMGAQREGQLDTLASGASGERANSLATMLGLGTGLAGGEAGLGLGYDSGAASAMSGANNNGLQLGMGGVMLPYSANQNLMQTLLGL